MTELDPQLPFQAGHPDPVIPSTVVVTGHFPPEPGGVQTFTWELVRRLPADRIVVIAPYRRGAAAHDRALPFPVIRRRGYLLTRDLARIAADAGATAAWIPALAPIGMLAPLVRRAGLDRVVASSHGQEIGWLRAAPTRAALRRAVGYLDVLTHLTPYTGRLLATVVDQPAKLVQLAGGVDLDVFRPGPRAGGPRAGGPEAGGLPAGAATGVIPRPRSGGPTVISVARLVRRKGHDMLLAAWPAVLAAVPDARLVIVGVGPMRPRLERAAAAPALSGTVRLTGYLPQRELAGQLADADVFVLPCRDDRAGLQVEGLGLSVLEGSAAGLPVVVGRSGGSVDAVRDGVTGRLVRAERPAEIAAALIGLLRDPVGARAMGAAGRHWVRDTWSWTAAAPILGAVLAGRPVGRVAGRAAGRAAGGPDRPAGTG